MATIKLTKNELRIQQNKLTQLAKYLPTLQLKKALLQAEVQEARHEIEKLEEELYEKEKAVEEFAALFAQKIALDIAAFAKVQEVHKRYENIAGCDVPFFIEATFRDLDYDLFDTPAWIDCAISKLRIVSSLSAQSKVVVEKKALLEKELRDVTIRVNLFEKILIPRCEKNIKTIKVFLGDQQLAAVSQAKVAKTKIQEHKVGRESYAR